MPQTLIENNPITRQHLMLQIPLAAFTLFAGPERTADSYYTDDCAYFRKNAGRTLCIRRAGLEYGEFDKHWTYKRLGLDLPPLWILVRQERIGFHTITSAWRGAAHWPTRKAETLHEYDACASDDAVLLLYQQFAQMGGMSTPCMERMNQQSDAIAAAHSAVCKQSGPVH